MIPIFVADAERVADEQSTHSRAVDEQVAVDLAPVVEANALDESALRVLDHVDDLALDPFDPARFAFGAHEAREERRIEMIGIVDVGERRIGIASIGKREAVFPGRHAAQRIVVEVLDRLRVALARGKPQLVRMQPQHVAADFAEAVDVVFARRSPIDELNTELERGFCRRDHLERIDPGQRE